MTRCFRGWWWRRERWRRWSRRRYPECHSQRHCYSSIFHINNACPWWSALIQWIIFPRIPIRPVLENVFLIHRRWTKPWLQEECYISQVYFSCVFDSVKNYLILRILFFFLFRDDCCISFKCLQHVLSFFSLSLGMLSDCWSFLDTAVSFWCAVRIALIIVAFIIIFVNRIWLRHNGGNIEVFIEIEIEVKHYWHFCRCHPSLQLVSS